MCTSILSASHHGTDIRDAALSSPREPGQGRPRHMRCDVTGPRPHTRPMGQTLDPGQCQHHTGHNCLAADI